MDGWMLIAAGGEMHVLDVMILMGTCWQRRGADFWMLLKRWSMFQALHFTLLKCEGHGGAVEWRLCNWNIAFWGDLSPISLNIAAGVHLNVCRNYYIFGSKSLSCVVERNPR